MSKKDKKKLIICIILFFAAMFVCAGIIMFSIMQNGFNSSELNIAPAMKITVICGLAFAACSTVLGEVSFKIKKPVGIPMFAIAAWNFICAIGINIAVFALKLIPV